MATISKEKYQAFVKSLNENTPCYFITDSPSKLGAIKTFKVEDMDLKIELKCSQIGGFFTGNYCYTNKY